MMAEVFIGRNGRHNPITSMRLVAERNLKSPAWRISAVIGMIAAFAILSFYSVIGGWAASYVGHAAMGDFTGGTAESIGDLFGGLFGTLFFVLLLFAAWTSGISLLEPVVIEIVPAGTFYPARAQALTLRLL